MGLCLFHKQYATTISVAILNHSILRFFSLYICLCYMLYIYIFVQFKRLFHLQRSVTFNNYYLFQRIN